MANIVKEGWLEFWVCTKTAVLWGRCDKVHCHGEGTNFFSTFSAFFTKWYP